MSYSRVPSIMTSELSRRSDQKQFSISSTRKGVWNENQKPWIIIDGSQLYSIQVLYSESRNREHIRM